MQGADSHAFGFCTWPLGAGLCLGNFGPCRFRRHNFSGLTPHSVLRTGGICRSGHRGVGFTASPLGRRPTWPRNRQSLIIAVITGGESQPLPRAFCPLSPGLPGPGGLNATSQFPHCVRTHLKHRKSLAGKTAVREGYDPSWPQFLFDCGNRILPKRCRSPMLGHAVLLCLNNVNAANQTPTHFDCSAILFST
jgi:hypothetical protein